MKHPKLAVEERTILGKQIKKLRRVGIVPANIYGKHLSSLAIQVKLTDFKPLYDEVGETGLIDIQVKGESRPVLIKNIHWNYRTRTPLHVDFYQVNLKEKVRSMVPLVIVGEAKAVTDEAGLMLQTLNEVEVEALPEALPENIEVAVEKLAAIDDQITVGDLTSPEGVTILTEPGQTIVKIAELVVEEPEPEVPVEGEEGAESETPAEGGETSEGAAEGEGENNETKKETKDEEK